ncbi:hypothetical protein CsatB_013508 [Cannabis sativa]
MEINTRLQNTSPISILQANELFVKKILSRSSSIGENNNNNGLPNFNTAATIPFKWESRPGIPKDLPKAPSIELHRDHPPPIIEARSARVVLSSTTRGGGRGGPRRLWKLPNKTNMLKKSMVNNNNNKVEATTKEDQNERSYHYLMDYNYKGSISGAEFGSFPSMGSFLDYSSSSPTMNSNYCNILMRKKISKVKNMALGCINGLY